MYNHLRTLLLNQHPAAPDWAIGEEAVPATFRPVNLPAYLDEVRARLFGVAPDRSMLNYRLAQYTRLLHASALGQYVYDLDPRVTYLGTDRTDLFGTAAFEPAVTQTKGRRPLVVQGDPAAPDPTGQSYHAYRIEQLDGDTISVGEDHPTSKNRLLDLAFAGGLSAPVPLGDSGYVALVPQEAAGTRWQVTFHARPQWDLGQIAAALRVSGEPTLLQLFGAAPAEPFLTFRDLFFDHPELPYRLGGLLLAVAYRSDAVWRANGQG